MIYAVSEVGDMTDFLKAHPFISLEDYMWKISVPMLRLMALDYTRYRYLSDEEVEFNKGKKKELDDFKNDFGIPVFE